MTTQEDVTGESLIEAMKRRHPAKRKSKPVYNVQYGLGIATGALVGFWMQDRHGSKEAYIQYLIDLPNAWYGWVQFPVWLLITGIFGCFLAAIITERR